MATLNLGRIKPVFRGAYNNGTAYVVDDIVTSGGSSYICIQASTGNAVSSATYWTLMAQGGTDVGTTLTTQGDILYRDGSGLQRLAKGTASQVLQMNTSANAPEWGTVSSDFVKILTSDYSTAVSQIDLDNIFSSTYRGYKILIEDNRQAGSGGNELQMRFLNTSGAEQSGSHYIMNAGGNYHSAGSGNASVNGYDNNRSSGRLGNWNMPNDSEPRPSIFELTFGQMHLNKEHSFIYNAKLFDPNGNYDAAVIGGIRYAQSVATRGIRLMVNGGGNFSAYRITVWGMK